MPEQRDLDIYGDMGLRLTPMGFALDGGRILTCVPTWSSHARRSLSSRPTGIAVVAAPEGSVDVARGTGRQPTVTVPPLREVVSALAELQQGQRHLTPMYGSPYIDKPIRTFFARSSVVSVTSLSLASLLSAMALANYVMGKSRSEAYGLVERTWREGRHLVADLSTMVWVSVAATRGMRPEAAAARLSLPVDEASAIRRALRTPGDAAAWVAGIMWLGCWRDHMHTKKDRTSSSMREWFDRVSSPLKSPSPMTRGELASYDGIREAMRIGVEALSPCFVLPEDDEDDGDPIDVMASWRAWDSWAETHDGAASDAPGGDLPWRAGLDLGDDESAEWEPEEERDDVIPEFLVARHRMIEEALEEEEEM